MGCGDDRHDKFAVVNGVDDANPQKPRVTSESAYAGWPRLVGQPVDCGDDLGLSGPVDLAELGIRLPSAA